MVRQNETKDGHDNEQQIFGSQWDSVDSGPVLFAKDGRTRFDNIKKQMSEKLTEVMGVNDVVFTVDFFSEGYLNEVLPLGWFVLDPSLYESLSDAFSDVVCNRMGCKRKDGRITYGYNDEMIACCIREDVNSNNKVLDAERRYRKFEKYVPNKKRDDGKGNPILDCSVKEIKMTEVKK